jgi:flagellar basal-body rod modification protein FlgD
MSTDAIASSLLTSSAITSSSSTDSTYSLGTEDFLQLLLTELENQDPTDPVSTSEMTNQFCSLTQVTQLETANEYLENLVLYSSSVNNSLSVAFIGKTISYSSGEISISGGAAESVSFSLASDAKNVSITISDEDGNTVDTVDLGSLSEGAHSFTWDCISSDGTTAADGTYTLSISATDGSGNSVSASTSGSATVSGVVYKDGVSYLVTDAGEIPLGSVTGISS